MRNLRKDHKTVESLPLPERLMYWRQRMRAEKDPKTRALCLRQFRMVRNLMDKTLEFKGEVN